MTQRTCFVAQPFKEPFQTRFEETIRPAVEAAGLVTYKVDLDPAADRLADDIHAGIERAAVVLVDITEENANVWYELGYSQALRKKLVMISCSTERDAGKPYPFDVRHRKIIDYQSRLLKDQRKLQADITERITALLAQPSPETDAERPGPAAPEPRLYDDDDRLSMLESWLGRRSEVENTSVMHLSEVAREVGLTADDVAKHIGAAAGRWRYRIHRQGSGTVLLVRDRFPV